MALYSHSRISCFENCPYKYKLKYIDKVRPEIEQSVEAFMGSMVHSALEKLYKDLRFKKLNSLAQLLEFYNEQWKKNWNHAILIVRQDYTAENYRQMGESYIKSYYERHHPFDHTRTVGLEQRVMLDLNDDKRFMLQGYMDRLAYSEPGVYEIHDYKTNSSLPLQEYLQNDRQLALYAMAVMKSYPNAKSIKLIWHFLPFNQDITLEKTKEELEKLRLETIEAIKRIESTADFRTKTGKLCDWCEFRTMCPEWAHVAKTENMTLDKFMDEPGVKLVNKFAELTEKKQAIEEEMDKVREALFRFAEAHGVSLVAGSGHTAKVWSAEKLRFPGREEAGRADLEDFIRKAGLWGDVSSLDTFMLSKKMDNPPWPADITKAIERFGKREEIKRLYLRKKDGPG